MSSLEKSAAKAESALATLEKLETTQLLNEKDAPAWLLKLFALVNRRRNQPVVDVKPLPRFDPFSVRKGHSKSVEKTILYLAYGSNLAAATFQGNRGIRPLSAINVVVPDLEVVFDLSGFPYTEPCFANSRFRSEKAVPSVVLNPTPVSMGDALLVNSISAVDGWSATAIGWKKGMVGVVYEVTPEDYAHIIATEGGDSSYADIEISCYPISKDQDTIPEHPQGPSFKAHTLYAKGEHNGRDRRREGWAQPSKRYLNLIRTGSKEHQLPMEYRNWLATLKSYTMTSWRQDVGRSLFLATWVPWVLAVMGIARAASDEKGRSPAWSQWLTLKLFMVMWGELILWHNPCGLQALGMMNPQQDEESSLRGLALLLTQPPTRGNISIPLELDASLTESLKRGNPCEEIAISPIVDVLEADHSLCCRLGTRTYIVIFAVLRLSKSCWTQQRGLCLLAESLREEDFPYAVSQSTAAGECSPLARRKARIGREILTKSFRSFTNKKADSGTRRWMGILTHELLTNCEENLELLASEPEDRRYLLGHTASMEQDKVVGIIAGMIIRTLIANGTPGRYFWPSDVQSKVYAEFPTSQGPESQWVEAFIDYTEEWISGSSETQSEKCTYYALDLRLYDESKGLYERASSDTILVVLQGNITIMMPASGERAALYFDISMEDVVRAKVQRPAPSITPSGSSNPHIVVIQLIEVLDRFAKDNVHQNCLGLQVSYVWITFQTLETAEDVCDYIHARIPARLALRGSIAEEALDVSQHSQVPRLRSESEESLGNSNGMEQNGVSVSQMDTDGYPNFTFHGRPLQRTTDVTQELEGIGLDKWQAGAQAIEDALDFRVLNDGSTLANAAIPKHISSSNDVAPSADRLHLQGSRPEFEANSKEYSNKYDNKQSGTHLEANSSVPNISNPFHIDPRGFLVQQTGAQMKLAPSEDTQRDLTNQATRSKAKRSQPDDRSPRTISSANLTLNEETIPTETRSNPHRILDQNLIPPLRKYEERGVRSTPNKPQRKSTPKVPRQTIASEQVPSRTSLNNTVPSIFDIEDTSEDSEPAQKRLKVSAKKLPSSSDAGGQPKQLQSTSSHPPKTGPATKKRGPKPKPAKKKSQPMPRALNHASTRRAAALNANERIHNISLGEQSTSQSLQPIEEVVLRQRINGSQTNGSILGNMPHGDQLALAPDPQESNGQSHNASEPRYDGDHDARGSRKDYTITQAMVDSCTQTLIDPTSPSEGIKSGSKKDNRREVRKPISMREASSPTSADKDNRILHSPPYANSSPTTNHEVNFTLREFSAASKHLDDEVIFDGETMAEMFVNENQSAATVTPQLPSMNPDFKLDQNPGAYPPALTGTRPISTRDILPSDSNEAYSKKLSSTGKDEEGLTPKNRTNPTSGKKRINDSIASKLSSALSGLPIERVHGSLSRFKRPGIKNIPPRKSYGDCEVPLSDSRQVATEAHLSNIDQRIPESVTKTRPRSTCSKLKGSRDRENNNIVQTSSTKPTANLKPSVVMAESKPEQVHRHTEYNQFGHYSTRVHGDKGHDYLSQNIDHSPLKSRDAREEGQVQVPERYETLEQQSTPKNSGIATKWRVGTGEVTPQPVRRSKAEHNAITISSNSDESSATEQPATPQGRTSKLSFEALPLPDDHTIRKPSLIEFDRQGPRNQGKVSLGKRTSKLPKTKVDSPADIDHGRGTLDLPPLDISVKNPNLKPQISPSVRRKQLRISRLSASPTAGSQMVFARRRERSHLSRNQSSQATVGEHGSPIQSRRTIRRATSGVDATQLIEELELEGEPFPPPYSDAMEGRLDRTNHASSRSAQELPTSVSPSGFTYCDAFPSSNRKHTPSSPHEPSQMLKDMTIHRQEAEGTYTNLNTASVVKPLELSDPFLTSTSKQDIKSFIQKPSFKRKVYASPARDWISKAQGLLPKKEYNPAGPEKQAEATRNPLREILPTTLPGVMITGEAESRHTGHSIIDKDIGNLDLSFLRKFRAITTNEEQSKPIESTDSGQPIGQHKKDIRHTINAKDPDRTLVEDNTVKKVRYPLPAPDPGGGNTTPEISEHGPNESSQATELSVSSTENREQQWLESLRSDQSRTLGSLYDLSNRLCRHLMDNESALQDVVSDYRAAGTRMVDELERAHLAIHDDFSTRASSMKRSLVNMIDNARDNLTQNVGKIKRTRLVDIENALEEEQGRISNMIEAAIESCGQ